MVSIYPNSSYYNAQEVVVVLVDISNTVWMQSNKEYQLNHNILIVHIVAMDQAYVQLKQFLQVPQGPHITTLQTINLSILFSIDLLQLLWHLLGGVHMLRVLCRVRPVHLLIMQLLL